FELPALKPNAKPEEESVPSLLTVIVREGTGVMETLTRTLPVLEPQRPSKPPVINVDFFPESGDLVGGEGLLNRVYVRFQDGRSDHAIDATAELIETTTATATATDPQASADSAAAPAIVTGLSS